MCFFSCFLLYLLKKGDDVLMKISDLVKQLEKKGIRIFEPRSFFVSERVRGTITCKKDFDAFVSLLEEKKVSFCFIEEHYYTKALYCIGEIDETKLKKVKQLKALQQAIDTYNHNLPPGEQLLIGHTMTAVIDGVAYHMEAIDETYCLPQPKEALEYVLLEGEFDAIGQQLEELEEKEEMEEEIKAQRQLQAKRKPLEEAILHDEVFAACTTKGARCLRVKELAMELEVLCYIPTIKSELESYVDLLMIKAKEQEKKAQ